jgi:peroxiredoxin Q/BCP
MTAACAVDRPPALAKAATAHRLAHREAQMSKTLQIGDPAPNFDLPTDSGGRISLAKLKGKSVVLFFYPKDDTPTCTVENLSFSEKAKAFEQANALVIGISKDSPATHDKFKAKHGLNVLLASDETGKTLEDYGVWTEKNMYGRKYMGIERTTYLVNAKGRISEIWRKVRVKGHVDAVLRKINDD